MSAPRKVLRQRTACSPPEPKISAMLDDVVERGRTDTFDKILAAINLLQSESAQNENTITQIVQQLIELIGRWRLTTPLDKSAEFLIQILGAHPSSRRDAFARRVAESHSRIVA